MGLFEHFPYSNFHDLNLNWIIGKIKNIEQITADVEEQSAAAVQSAADAAASAEAAAGSAEAAAGSAQEAADTVEPFTSTVTEIRARMNAFVEQHSGPADETVLYSSDTPVFSGTITPSEAFAGYQNIKFVWQHRGDICEQEFKLTGESGQNFNLRDCFGYYGANNTAGWEMCQMQLIMQQTGELQFTAATVIDNLQYNDGPVDNTMNTGILQVIGIRNVADTEVVDARVATDGTIYPTLEERLNAEFSNASGLTEEIKQALLNAFNHVAWDDDDPTGQSYIDALQNALYPPANLTRISAVYTQSGAVYTTDSLDSLKPDLVVTAHYSDSTSETVEAYTLSGELTEGTSTITVLYGGKTTTFNVIVTTRPEMWAVEYSGNFTTDTPSTTRVTLISNDITFNPGDTKIATAASGYKIFAIDEYATHGNESLNRTAKSTNQIYVNAQTNSGYLPALNAQVLGVGAGYITKSIGGWTGDGGSITFTYPDSNTTSMTIGGLSFYVEKVDGSDITINEADAALTIA